MGISKRNPRGNFGWQSRILKKKAQCCGDLDEPFDCDALAPVISFTGPTVLCDNGLPVSASVTNTKPGQTTTWEWYLNGTLVNSTTSYSWNPPVPADQGTYTIVATNQFGCTSQFDVYLTYVAEPVLNIATVDPTPPACDGEIYIEVTNFIPGISYIYELYDIVNNVLVGSVNTNVSDYTFTGLCLGQYAARVTPSVTTPSGVINTCATDYQYINLPNPSGPAFTLEFNTIAGLSIPNAWGPYSVTGWNNIMGSDYQICVVDTVFNKVYFYYTAGSLVMNDDAFLSLSFQIIGVDDSVADFVTLGDRAFRQSLLQYAQFDGVMTCGTDVFDNCGGLITVKMPLLTVATQGLFAACFSLDDPKLPSVTSIDGSFPGCSSLTTFGPTAGVIDLTGITTLGSLSFFNCTSITDVVAPDLLTMVNSNFRFCSSLQNFSAPLLTSMGNNNFNVLGPTLVLIDIPLCATISSSCANNGENFQKGNNLCYDASSNFTLNVPLSLATCNAGGPDADFVCFTLGLNPLVTVNYI